MNQDLSYRQASEFDHRFGRLKRLDFVVQTIRQHAQGRALQQMHVLEIGCGKGNIALPIASLGYPMIGIDLDIGSLRYATHRTAGSNASFVVMDVLRMGMDRKFDVIVCSEVIEHLDEPERMLAALPGLLKQDGIAIITTPNGFGPFELSSQLFYVQPLRLMKAIGLGAWLKKMRRRFAHVPHGPDSMNRSSPHVQFFRLGRLYKLLRQCGLEMIEVAHSDWLESATPLTRLYGLSERLARFDQRIADRLPGYMVSGWYVVCRAAGTSSTRAASDV